MSRAIRTLAFGALWASLLALSGCGQSLTGGSIPPGPTRAEGFVVRGDNTSVLVDDARLFFVPLSRAADGGRATGRFVVVNPGGSDPPPPPDFDSDDGPIFHVPTPTVPGTVTAQTGENGRFGASGFTSGTYQLLLAPPAETGLSAMQYTLEFSTGESWWLVLAPPRANTSFNGMSGIAIEPASIDIRVGEVTQVVVHAVGGAPPSVAPSYLLQGDLAVVNAQGRVAGVRPGVGRLHVVLGPFRQSIPVRVRSAQ